MPEGSVVEKQAALSSDLASLATVEHSGDGDLLIAGLRFRAMLRRQADYESLAFVAALDRRGEFAERGGRPAVTVADILRCRPVEARRMVALARSLFPRTLDGQVLEPEFPATAAAVASFAIDQAHAEVIERALHSDAARRIPPEQWVEAEVQLAGWARQYRPDELAKLADQLIEVLDQDGAPPGDDSPQVNELYLAKSRHGVGGRITGRLDASTFEVLSRAIRAHVMPGDGQLSLGERQAAALGEICEHALDEGRLPAEGGERPHVTMVLDYERLRQLSRGVILDYGGELSSYAGCCATRRLFRWCWAGTVNLWTWAARSARRRWRSVRRSRLGMVGVPILVVIARPTAARFITCTRGSTAVAPTLTTS